MVNDRYSHLNGHNIVTSKNFDNVVFDDRLVVFGRAEDAKVERGKRGWLESALFLHAVSLHNYIFLLRCLSFPIQLYFVLRKLL